MRWAYLLWMWYWGRWEECLGQTTPDDDPEMLQRVGEWLSWHLFCVVGMAWAMISWSQ